MLDSLRLVIRVLFAIFCVGLFNGCTNAPNRYLDSTDTTSTRDVIQTVQISPSETISPSNNLPTTELITSTPKSSIFHYETGNRLFVFHDGYITLFDTLSHEQEKATFPIYCKNGLLPHTELLYCENETDLLLLDPISKESQIIGTGINPNFYKSSPSGEFLLLIEEADDTPVFVRYNMNTKELRNFQIDKKPSDNISFPIISDNGNYVAYEKRNNEHKSKIITENIENKGTQEFSIIDADEIQLISWFPDSQKILVGASDLNTDMPG
ncbi:MAG: hypothetical protein HY835_00675, partial [Anaerolineae bacterium]|nr:hypothetical protein [Anaerolineae bacterium]